MLWLGCRAKARRGFQGGGGWGQGPGKVSGDVILLGSQVPKLVLSFQIM